VLIGVIGVHLCCDRTTHMPHRAAPRRPRRLFRIYSALDGADPFNRQQVNRPSRNVGEGDAARSEEACLDLLGDESGRPPGPQPVPTRTSEAYTALSGGLSCSEWTALPLALFPAVFPEHTFASLAHTTPAATIGPDEESPRRSIHYEALPLLHDDLAL
jgi:hypothetical protein